MLKVIIADDEVETQQGLIEYIDWKELDISVVGHALDGRQALELAKKKVPDIVLTDVRMPVMDGIEFVKEYRKENPDCMVIFMSGYSDKEYLKSAIHLKAVDYIEKPIMLADVIAALKNASQRYLEEKLKNDVVKNKKTLINSDTSIARQELALQLLHRNVNLDSIKMMATSADVHLPLNDNYICALLKFNLHKVNSLDNVIVSEKSSIIGLIETALKSYTTSYLVALIDGKYAVIHIYGKYAENRILLMSTLKQVQNEINRYYKSESFTSIGVGQLVRGVENVARSYQVARKAIQKNFLLGYSSIHFYDENPSEVNISDNTGTSISELINSGDIDKAMQMLEQFSVRIKNSRNCDINYVKSIFLSLMMNITSTARDAGIGIFEDDKDNELKWAEMLNDYTLDDLCAFIADKLKLLSESIEEYRGKSRKVIAAMGYIKEHFMEELSIMGISEEVGLSHTYLCQVFKKETGKTLNEYIEEIRIDKAKELLRNSEIKLQEVAERVGYNNQTYFARVFKKVTGSNASDYRRKVRI